MRLKTQSVKELQAILKRDYGRDVSEEEAQKIGASLLRLTRIAIRTMASLEEGDAASVAPGNLTSKASGCPISV